jgi:hypothetical protein
MIYFYKFFHNFYYKNKFILFNKKYFKNKKISEIDEKILIEFNAFHDSHVNLSIFSNYFREKYNYKIVAFFNYSLLSAGLYFSLYNKIKWNLGNFFSLKNFGIYKSFNTKKIIRPIINKYIFSQSKKIFLKTIRNIKNKNDLLNLKIDDILIGDLLYDTYLKSRVTPTINIYSKDFRNFYLDFICLLLFWTDYFKNNKVKIILGVHSVYSYAVPLRAAIKVGVEAYIVHTNEIIKYSQDNMFGTVHTSSDYKDYKKNFRNLPKKVQQKGLEMSKLKLQKRFRGAVGVNVNMPYADKSSFSSNKNSLSLKKNDKFKILICTHDFFDSPHIYGKFLFSDHYEWLNYLSELSKLTDFEWYIKNHPNYGGKFQIYQKFTDDVVFRIFNNHPKIKILPNNTSHKNLIKEGIKAVLTCYGSVAIEYAYFSIPSVIACPASPYLNYKFILNPKTISEYKSTIMELDQIKFKVNKREIFEFYFMKNLLQRDDWLGLNYQKILRRVGGYHYLRTENFYKFWINYYNNKINKKIYNNITSFLISKNNYFLRST